MENEKSTVDLFQFSFSIKEIKLVDFILSEENLNSDIKYSVNTLFFEQNVNIKTDVNLNSIAISLTIFIYSDINKTAQLGQISSIANFNVIELNKILIKYENKLPNILLANLIGLLISTTRGFLILKSEGTKLDGLMLPAIDPMTFFSHNK